MALWLLALPIARVKGGILVLPLIGPTPNADSEAGLGSSKAFICGDGEHHGDIGGEWEGSAGLRRELWGEVSLVTHSTIGCGDGSWRADGVGKCCSWMASTRAQSVLISSQFWSNLAFNFAFSLFRRCIFSAIDSFNLIMFLLRMKTSSSTSYNQASSVMPGVPAAEGEVGGLVAETAGVDTVLASQDFNLEDKGLWICSAHVFSNVND